MVSFKALCFCIRPMAKNNIILVDLAVLQRALPEGALYRIAAAIAQHHGKLADLALAEIVADALAEHRLLAIGVQRIIDELRGKAEIAAGTIEGPPLPIRAGWR